MPGRAELSSQVTQRTDLAAIAGEEDEDPSEEVSWQVYSNK